MTLTLFKNKDCIECGLDECGRGSLAGPVVVAAVVWPQDEGEHDHMIRDSKKLSVSKRVALVEYIKERALDWTVRFVDAKVVDEINILQATFKGMHGCLDGLTVPVDHILVDGDKFKPYGNISHTCVVKGDDTYISIAAASILAKVARDDYMKQQSKRYNVYGWEKNVGYGTTSHIEAIRKHGLCELHRRSFCTKLASSGCEDPLH